MVADTGGRGGGGRAHLPTEDGRDMSSTTAISEISIGRRAAEYRHLYGLPGYLTPAGQIVMRTGPEAGAVTVHGEQAAIVREDLDRRGLVGPISYHARSGAMTFFTGPLPGNVAMLTYARLYRMHVSVLPPGGTATLPSPGDECAGVRVWLRQPDGALPPGQAVIDAILEIGQ